MGFGVIGINTSHAGDPNFNTLLPDSDNDQDNYGLTAFFDLRDRESFVQVTNTNGTPLKMHIQIFNVALNCNENNFFDDYTINDTHTYNLRDITTNDGNPSGVVLPDNAYGIVVITPVGANLEFLESNLFGNFRILDNSGYEYRTNLSGWNLFPPAVDLIDEGEFTFNFYIRRCRVVGRLIIWIGFGIFLLHKTHGTATAASSSSFKKRDTFGHGRRSIIWVGFGILPIQNTHATVRHCFPRRIFIAVTIISRSSCA